MAFQLGLTLDQLYDMSSKEYMGWHQYFDKRPNGWQDDHRTALIMQTTYQGSKKVNFNEYFPSLKKIYASNDNTIDKAQAFIASTQAKSIATRKIDIT